MNKPGDIIWNIPFYFFVFLGLFISIKFIFIFFFRAAFEPQFIFDLTPFYVLSGVNSLQLLFLSLIVVGYDTYLHMQPTRKNILRSFIPTALMLCGLGLGITTKEISFSYLANYLLFGLLLFIIIVDHRRTLISPEMLPPKAPPKPLPSLSRMKLPFFTKPKSQKASPTTKPRLSFSAVSSIFSVFKRGKKIGVNDKVQKSTIEQKISPLEAKQKEKSAKKPMGEEKPEAPTSPQEIEPQEPSHTVEGQSGSTDGGVFGSPQVSGAAMPQSTPQKVGTIPYYKDQSPPGTKTKLSLSIITSVFGKRKKTREPERRTTVPVKSQAESSQKEDQKEGPIEKAAVKIKQDKQKVIQAQKTESETPSEILEDKKEKVSLGGEESLPVFKESPPDKEERTQEMKKEVGEAIFPIVTESTEDKESEQQKIIKDEIKAPIASKQEVGISEEELYERKKEIEGEITIFKDLKSNYENIQSGLDSLKNELENICEDIRLSDRKPSVLKTKPEKRELKEEIMNKTMITPYLSGPEKIPTKKISKPSTYSMKWNKSAKRLHDLRKAKVLLNELGKKVEKLERIYI